MLRILKKVIFKYIFNMLKNSSFLTTHITIIYSLGLWVIGLSGVHVLLSKLLFSGVPPEGV